MGWGGVGGARAIVGEPAPEALAGLAQGCGELRALKALNFGGNDGLLATGDAGQALGSLLAKCAALETLRGLGFLKVFLKRKKL